jgi:carboxymethylenebutenolidase
MPAHQTRDAPTDRDGIVRIDGPLGVIPTFVAEPSGTGPCPGVVVVHDALGMTADLRRQAQWLADAGYLAAAPDLFHWGGRMSCLFKIFKELGRGEGRTFDDLSAVRRWLLDRPRCTGHVGIIGFCMGGGFALLLAPSKQYAASAPNYGAMREATWDRLASACPIVASYGANDPSLKGAAARLERTLTMHGIPHDVKEYPGAGHSFMNDHDRADAPWLFRLMQRVSHGGYNADATADARRRIVAFFDTHLR